VAAYYNEIDKFAAAWLRELIKEGLIADGEVDERSIEDVQPGDVRGFTQCHFFAGIGGWSQALRLAGWPDDRPLWTGSCPCQPYSVASVGVGGAEGQRDPRHLWPSWFRLARQCRPGIITGEQVASAIQWGWWDQVALDLEDEAYACAAVVLRADAIGADHQRKRLYWVAQSGSAGWEGHQQIQCVPQSTPAAFPIDGYPLTRARRALDGDYGDLLPCDGLSVVMERHALKGYGNAIVPQVAAEFIKGFACGYAG
jgi:DNA (cytosine-5)-methyltransferase 1